MNDVFLASRLQTAMGDAYRLERELPGGGMSRLFVALESSLNRRVVIKVLPPELTSDVSAARFKQEIEFAAHLQHPHILPILAAGAKDDLLYYVMPYVTGESLRQHIEKGGAMPVVDAVRILREVADALAYAHRKGIVHRDIKPENILLEEGHAVLADFGVARAIDEARSGIGLPRVTGTGMSVGTPWYMAPEQASGERHIDARADLYALGVVAYEMLAGVLPFSAPSAQAMVVAHLTTPPPPITKARPDAPANVSAAIAKALAKSPDDRYRTAEEFRDALEIAATGAGGGRRRWVVAGAAAAAVIAAIALVATWRSRPKLDDNVVAIAPFDVVDPDLKLWHEGMVDVLSRNLDGAGELRTVAPSVVIRRWSGRADKASAAELGMATGARYVVLGSLLRGGDTVKASVSVVDVRSSRTIVEIERKDIPARIDRLADSLTFALVGQLRPGTQKLSSIGTNSLPALKAYLQGEQHFRHSAWDSAAAAYGRAVEIDSAFALANHGLGLSYGWSHTGGDSLGEFYSARAGRHNHGLAPRDSLLIVGDSIEVALFAPHGDPLTVQHRRRLFATQELAAQRYPDDPVVLYALGDARYHFAWGAGVGLPPEKVLEPFDRAIALDSAFTPAYIHAIQLAFRLGGVQAGRRYLRAYLAQGPTDVEANAMRLAERLSDPARARSAETAAILDSANNGELLRANNALRAWADTEEAALRLIRLLSPTRRSNWSQEGDTAYQRQRLASGMLDRGHAREAFAYGPYHAWQQGAIALLGGYSPDSVRALASRIRRRGGGDSCAMCFYNYWAARGDTAAIVGVGQRVDSALRADTSAAARRVRPFFAQLAQAYVLLARHDSAGALRAIEALPDSLCHQCGIWEITQAQLLEAKGRDREALALLSIVNVGEDAYSMSLTLERARVAERLGERAIAVDGYLQVAGMWQHGDSVFAPYVTESRAALKRLGGESARGLKVGGAPGSR